MEQKKASQAKPVEKAPADYESEYEEGNDVEEDIGDDYEEELTPQQEEIVKSKVADCKGVLKILKPEEIRRVCIEFEFEEERIDAYIKCYSIEEKYKDVAAFQWQETLTREQKAHNRRLKLLEVERQRRNQ